MGSDGDADARLDRAFMARAAPVRRAIVARLSRGSAPVNELAAPFDLTKQAVSKHIQVLEQAGLVPRTRDAQRRPVHLDAAALERLTAWIDRYRLDAERSYRQLDTLLTAMTHKEGTEKLQTPSASTLRSTTSPWSSPLPPTPRGTPPSRP